MSKIKETILEILEFNKVLEKIEEYLPEKTENILRELGSLGYTEKVLNKRMELFYISFYEPTIRGYIKRRKNQEGILNLKRSKFKDKEEKYDTFDLLTKYMLLYIIDNYGFCKLDIKKEDIVKSDVDVKQLLTCTPMSNVNVKKLLTCTFTEENLIYPVLKNGELYESSSIIQFNEEYLGKNYAKNEICKYLKFKYFNSYNFIEINNITYHLNDRRWIRANLEEILDSKVHEKLSDNLCNYRTILSETKEFLRIIMDINNGKIKCENEQIISASKTYSHIKSEADIERHYKKSVAEIKSQLTEDGWNIFEAVLRIENNKNHPNYNTYVRSTVQDFSEGFDSVYRQILYMQDKALVFALLIKGYLYIN